MNQITFDSENYVDVLRAELERRHERKMQRRWELVATIAIAIIAAIVLVYWKAL